MREACPGKAPKISKKIWWQSFRFAFFVSLFLALSHRWFFMVCFVANWHLAMLGGRCREANKDVIDWNGRIDWRRCFLVWRVYANDRESAETQFPRVVWDHMFTLPMASCDNCIETQLGSLSESTWFVSKNFRRGRWRDYAPTINLSLCVGESRSFCRFWWIVLQ